MYVCMCAHMMYCSNSINRSYILLHFVSVVYHSIRGSSLPFATIQWLNLHQLIHAMVFHPLYTKTKSQKTEQHDVSTPTKTTSKQHGRPTLQQKRDQFGHFSFTTDRFSQLLFHSIFCIKKSCIKPESPK